MLPVGPFVRGSPTRPVNIAADDYHPRHRIGGPAIGFEKLARASVAEELRVQEMDEIDFRSAQSAIIVLNRSRVRSNRGCRLGEAKIRQERTLRL